MLGVEGDVKHCCLACHRLDRHCVSLQSYPVPMYASVCVCVCVCVSESVSVTHRQSGRQREREREIGRREGGREGGMSDVLPICWGGRGGESHERQYPCRLAFARANRTY